jgi:demethylspheroidene O-methyltransferase
LLRSIFRSLRPGHRLLIAEPMAATPGAEPMGDAYFGLYLWAMGSGRPRRADEIIRLLDETGFRRSRVMTTAQPLIANLIVATA